MEFTILKFMFIESFVNSLQLWHPWRNKYTDECSIIVRTNSTNSLMIETHTHQRLKRWDIHLLLSTCAITDKKDCNLKLLMANEEKQNIMECMSLFCLVYQMTENVLFMIFGMPIKTLKINSLHHFGTQSPFIPVILSLFKFPRFVYVTKHK